MRLPPRAKATAAARPIPVNAPVIKTTGCFIAAPSAHFRLRLAEAGVCGAMRADLGFPRPVKKDFVSLVPYLAGIERGYGTKASALLRRRRGRGQPHTGSQAPVEHRAALPEPATS